MSFLLGTLALLGSSLSQNPVFVVSLAAIGLLLGLCGVAVPWARKRGLLLAWAGLSVSLPVLALAVFWPGLLGLAPLNLQEKPATDRQVVYALAPVKGAPRAEPRKSEWVDARQGAVEQGGVRVRVAAVALKSVKVKDGSGQNRVAGPGLVIKLRVSNAGANRLISYRSWGEGDPATLPRLTDNTGKAYACKGFGPGWSVVGRVRTAQLPPMKWIDDVLVFEATPASIEYLRLELPCAVFAAPGQMKFEIPRRLIALR
jgi:hypothetical protein